LTDDYSGDFEVLRNHAPDLVTGRTSVRASAACGDAGIAGRRWARRSGRCPSGRRRRTPGAGPGHPRCERRRAGGRSPAGEEPW